MKEHLTVVTRKGQITLPAEVRRALGIKQGDKVMVSLADPSSGQAAVRPVHSVTDLTFGAIPPRQQPEDLQELREAFKAAVVAHAAGAGSERGEQP